LNNLHRSKKILVFFGLYVLLTIMFLLTFSTGDDWTHLGWIANVRGGEDSYLDVLDRFYETNGRVLGNSVSLVTLHSFIFGALFRAAVTLGILWAVARIARVNQLFALPVILILVVVPTLPIFSQTMGWESGFNNYVVPVMFALMLILLFRDPSGWWRPILVFALATATGLFLETITIALVVASIGSLALAIWRRRVTYTHIGLVVGAFLGAAIMFRSPAYGRILSGNDDYRTTPDTSGGLAQGLSTVLQETSQSLAHNLVLNMSLLLGALAVVVFLATIGRLATGLAIGLMVGSMASIMVVGQAWRSGLIPGYWPGLTADVGVLGLFAVFVVTAAWALWSTGEERMKSAARWLLLGVAIVAPLLVVRPFGPRNFYPTAVCFVVAGVILAAPWFERAKKRPPVVVATLVASATVTTVLFSMLAVNKVVSLDNESALREAYVAGESTVTIRKYPFQALVHDNENAVKLLRSLQEVECDSQSCGEVRPMEIIFE